jgi:opacity protein-like surface antigen
MAAQKRGGCSNKDGPSVVSGARPEFHNNKAKFVQELSLMFGFRLSVKWVAVVLLAAAMVSGASAVEAQTAHRTRRESNANRKARIAKTIEETYSHRWELAGGGGYMRFNSGAPQRNNEVTFWMNATRYFTRNPKLGITGEVRGAYGNAKINNTGNINFNPQISEYPFLAGVTYRVYEKEKIAISIYGEGGVALGKFAGDSKGFDEASIGVWQSATRPAVSIGANFDYNFYPDIAFRFSPTYTPTFFRLPEGSISGPQGTAQNNLGFNIGLIYRFGKIK